VEPLYALPPDVKEAARALGEEINWALMQLAYSEEPESIYRRALRVKRAYRVFRERVDRAVQSLLDEGGYGAVEAALALEHAAGQIGELLGFTLRDLEEREGDGLGAHGAAIVWLARAQQEILYLLYRW